MPSQQHVRATVDCRQCGTADVENLGPIPRGREFAGQPLVPAWPGGSLMRCSRCHLAFRYPLQSDATYESLYEGASGEVWSSDGLRRDQLLVKDAIHQYSKSCSILDVGCYDGAFLEAMGPGYRKYGVEVCVSAAAIASGRGVEIIGSRIGEISHLGGEFDVVCAVDVIEHVSDPLRFLRDTRNRVREDGIIIISSGNTNAPAWRRLRSRFWYCSIPEHLSFVSEAWASAAAAELNLTLVSALAFKHAPEKPAFPLSHWLKLAAKTVASAIEAALPRPFSFRFRELGPRFALGVPGLFEDHILLVFRRPLSTAGDSATTVSVGSTNRLALAPSAAPDRTGCRRGDRMFIKPS